MLLEEDSNDSSNMPFCGSQAESLSLKSSFYPLSHLMGFYANHKKSLVMSEWASSSVKF